MKILLSNILSCFSEAAIGTRVVAPEKFMDILMEAVSKHDPETDRSPGQHFIVLPSEVHETVSAGVGLREGKQVEDFVVRDYLGDVNLYLKREHAVPVAGCNAIVYTREAYLNDPEVKEDAEEVARIEADPEGTHVLVAVLASGPEASERSPFRFVAALGGENNDYNFVVNPGGGLGNGEVRAKVDVDWVKKVAKLRDEAKAVIDHDRKWAVVAD